MRRATPLLIRLAALLFLCLPPTGAFAQDATSSQIDLGVAAFDRGDYEAALPHLIEAAIDEDSEAQYRIGEIYRRGLGLDPSFVNAAKWLRRAAEQGHLQATITLGGIYYWSAGNSDEPDQDYEEAMRWYAKAAERGDAKSQTVLAFGYLIGRGVEHNEERAVEWYRRAADQGYPRAIEGMGDNYKSATGVMQDYERAIEFYRQAARLGRSRAMHKIGLMHKRGRLKDLETALTWLILARMSGYKLASLAVGATERDMTPEQIDAAKRRAVRCFSSDFQDCD